MASSLSNLVDNLAKRIHGLNVNMDITIKISKPVELNTKIVSAVLNTQTLKMIQ